jgi:hypothetical protein
MVCGSCHNDYCKQASLDAEESKYPVFDTYLKEGFSTMYNQNKENNKILSFIIPSHA